jgi:trimethylamine:corrinoid methyltransferase-like protein
MGEILFGGRSEIARTPASISLINVNSPLRYDDRMLGAMFEYVKANQAVVITPFLLMGAMSPVSLPATLMQQMAEALAGVDVELLRELRHEFTPLEIDEASLAFDAHTEVGAGGHFLGAAHTLERFRECFYRPLLSSTENFDRWTKKGARDTTARAGEIWRKTLEEYEQPPLDEAIDAELREFVDRRRADLGD